MQVNVHLAQIYIPALDIVLHKDEGSSYGVTVPDLPGCFSAAGHSR